ncbi:hypothetical protein BS47DRAFT_1299804 [Hydnum rufescens UP504]|uniref:JmjC domain-containing histone demethylation protein 1 n=1 Tax=Hydnum rufescens UP504 TaxID=1448309 RepID=A0A9P6ARU5_9AGAM|nr:hypothetical protein BS47DRAFT_1299804 [Hydnum rufescens UP504]
MSKTRKTRRRQPAAASASQSAGGGATERLSDADNIKDNQAEDASDEENVTCPSCEANPKRRPSNSKDNWVECEACDIWYHWACVGRGPIDMVDKWFCADCMQKDPSRTVTFKVPQRKSARTTNKLDYANLNDGVESNPKRRLGFLATKPIKKHAFEYMKGQDVTMVWLGSDEKAMTEPIIIEHPDGLGMKMPEPGFTVRDVAKIVGSKEKVDVLDVASQQEDKGWTLESWVEYYYSPPERREKIRNVISLEISDTKLAEKISPPLLVRQIDWVEQNWPANKRKGPLYPKVQLYCLMSVAECWTDWHIDFAGSSVYYHILKGSKIFYFIRPTAANLAAYEKWSGSDMQESVWFGDLVDEVFKVELTEGNTMIIPTGWIHAVYTPVDSLVFGGNFLHSWNIATLHQKLRVRELEMSTRVEKKARFPFFRRRVDILHFPYTLSTLCWYTAEKALKDLKAKEEVPTRVLNGLDALATFLIREVRIMERATSSDPARKDSKDQLPAVIKDPAALARELRWRVRVAAGGESGDERETPFSRAGSSINGTAPVKRTSLTPVALSTTTGKRKRPNTDEVVRDARFKGFTPRPWDAVELRPIEADQRESVAIPARPVMADGLAWMDAATATGGQ